MKITIYRPLFFFMLSGVAHSLDFQISSFESGASNILYAGDAVSSFGAIELINELNYLSRVGQAIYFDRVHIWDSYSRKLTDFTTHFAFTINTPSNIYGHGIVFFLAPVGFQIPPNSAGGFLGLFNSTNLYSSKNQMVTVEFDSFPNSKEGWDPAYEHVGINSNSISSSVYSPWNASLHSGDTADVWIMYNATSMNLSVYWAYRDNPSFRQNSSLSYHIDLRTVLPEWTTIGFSAATGQYGEQNTIKSWEFTSSLDIKTKTNKHTKKDRVLIVSTTVSGGVVLFLTLLVLVFWFWRRKYSIRKSAELVAQNQGSINDEDLEQAGPRKFSYQALVVATKDFASVRKLGEGGFGCVYKGYLADLDIPIAVKKISRGSKQGKKEYVTEVKIISRLRHRNLVQLIGWCHDRGELLLAYEFMPNGSLDRHLFGNKGGPLPWSVRYKIVLGLASGLLYLHEEWEQCVVHRDIKPSNIMLDKSFNVKLGDFGLARLMDHELGPQTTGLAGTFGYLAPEYITSGKASKESDIYSFGIVVLEIVTGRRSVDTLQNETTLVQWAWDLYGRGETLLGVDGRLRMEFEEKQVERLMIVGLWCAHPDKNLRPSIRRAIQVVNFEAVMLSLPTKMPVPIYHTTAPLCLPAVSSGEASITYTSINVGR